MVCVVDICTKAIIMELELFWDTRFSFPSTIEEAQGQELIQHIRDDHQVIMHKLLPEIDLHFHNLLLQEMDETELDLRQIQLDFNDFSELLSDHIQTEELLILPYLASGEKLPNAAAKSFGDKHPDFEQALLVLLEKIKSQLAPLQGRLAFAVLTLKLERLQNLLHQHQVLEDFLFDGLN